jgi:hypothetical protein
MVLFCIGFRITIGALKLGFKQNADMISLKLLIFKRISSPHETLKCCLRELKLNLKEFRTTSITLRKLFVRNWLKKN